MLQGMTGAIREAEQLVAKTPGGYMLQQFENPSNPDIHFRTTGPEIWRDTAGSVAAFISGTSCSCLCSCLGRLPAHAALEIGMIVTSPWMQLC